MSPIHTSSAASDRNTPPAPALPRIAETIQTSSARAMRSTRSSIALMLRQDSSAGESLASMTPRCSPFDQQSVPPSRTRTRGPRASDAIDRRRQRLAIGGREGAVVEIEAQEADAVVFLVAQRRRACGERQVVEMRGHRLGRRQLDLVRARPLGLADPQRAVDETDRDRRVRERASASPGGPASPSAR